MLAGDRPDPSVLRDGDEYYLTLSSFDAYPGLPLWHSRDLVNWQPIGHAITTSVGSIWAPDLVRHEGRYYIYFPGRSDTGRSNYVVWADDIRGPWSEPVDLRLPEHIDPGHAVGEDGKRYLFLSGGDYVQLADDGLRTVGKVRHVYDGWRYPEDWVVESYSQEGPKISFRDGWFVAKGDDLSRPLPMPAGESIGRHGVALSDDFRGERLGPQWAFYAPGPGEMDRIVFVDGALVLQGKGSAPRDASPLTAISGDLAYQFEVEMVIEPGAIGGALLFYSDRLYAGLGSNGETFVMHRYGEERPATLAPGRGGKLWLRLTNDRNILTIHHSRDGERWEKYGVQMEVSGYHHNTAGRFLSLRPGVYAAGEGRVRFLEFRYRALG